MARGRQYQRNARNQRNARKPKPADTRTNNTTTRTQLNVPKKNTARRAQHGSITRIVRNTYGFIKCRKGKNQTFFLLCEAPLGVKVDDKVQFEVATNPTNGKQKAINIIAGSPNLTTDAPGPVDDQLDWKHLAQRSTNGWHFDPAQHTSSSTASTHSDDTWSEGTNADSIDSFLSLNFLDEDEDEQDDGAVAAPDISLEFLDEDEDASAAALIQDGWALGQRVFVRDEHEDSDWKLATITQLEPDVEACPDGWDESYEWTIIKAF